MGGGASCSDSGVDLAQATLVNRVAGSPPAAAPLLSARPWTLQEIKLFAFAPVTHEHNDYLGARPPPDEEMGGGYDVAVCGNFDVVSLVCLDESDSMTGWSPSSKQPRCSLSNFGGSRIVVVHGSYYLAEVLEVADFPNPLDVGHSTTPPSELSLTMCSKSSPDNMLNTDVLQANEVRCGGGALSEQNNDAAGP
ncbi:hypothetical protein ABZP36_004623 [Zizania latifolia]